MTLMLGLLILLGCTLVASSLDELRDAVKKLTEELKKK